MLQIIKQFLFGNFIVIILLHMYHTYYNLAGRHPVQNVPLPLLYPKEFHEGLWAGETVVQGFKKKGKFKRRVAHFWIPTLKKSVVYSEVLDSYMRIVITQRLTTLIHENYGFDHYLLKVH